MTIREQKVEEILQLIARDIQQKLPTGFKFCLITYENGETGEALFVSNSDRETVQKVMIQFCTKVKGDEDFGTAKQRGL